MRAEGGVRVACWPGVTSGWVRGGRRESTQRSGPGRVPGATGAEADEAEGAAGKDCDGQGAHRAGFQKERGAATPKAADRSREVGNAPCGSVPRSCPHCREQLQAAGRAEGTVEAGGGHTR